MAAATRRKPAAGGTGAYSGPYASLINSSARRNGIDPWLLAALLKIESNFNPKARSKAGAVGIAQIELSAHPGVTVAEAENPSFAIPWAARYLAELKKRAGGSTTGALRAYNTGSAQPSNAGTKYANAVLGARKSLRQQVQTAVASVFNFGHGGGYAGVDQGVDFTGKGAIPALADATVTDVGSSSIIEGGTYPYVVYRLDSGPHRGQFVYVAEKFKPSVKVGQKVQAGQSIGVATGGYPGIEVGFNKTPKGWNAVAPLPPKGQPTSAGQQMLAYLKNRTGGGSSAAVPVSATGQPVSLGGDILHGAETAGGLLGVPGLPGGLPGLPGGLPGIPGLPNPLSGVTGAFDAAKATGSLIVKFLSDPGYPFIWFGFFIVGLAFVFLGIERLLGRSAPRDAAGVGRGLAVVAAPEAAPLEVGA